VGSNRFKHEFPSKGVRLDFMVCEGELVEEGALTSVGKEARKIISSGCFRGV